MTTATTTLNPIDLEILQNALTAAAAEMDVTMWRTSRSTIVREMRRECLTLRSFPSHATQMVRLHPS